MPEESKQEWERLNLLLPAQLKRDIKAYAGREATTVSQLIRDYFVYLLERERLNAKGKAF